MIAAADRAGDLQVEEFLRSVDMPGITKAEPFRNAFAVLAQCLMERGPDTREVGPVACESPALDEAEHLRGKTPAAVELLERSESLSPQTNNNEKRSGPCSSPRSALRSNTTQWATVVELKMMPLYCFIDNRLSDGVMMATMVAELGMSTLPATCTGAVRCRQMTTEGACEKVKGLVVMASDGGALLVRKRESQTVKDIHGPAAVTTAIAPDGLAQIVEQAHDGNAVSGVIACMLEHMLIHLKGVLGKASVLLVVAIAAALEVARGQEIVDNGFDAGALGRAEDLTDPVSGIRHVRHGFGN